MQGASGQAGGRGGHGQGWYARVVKFKKPPAEWSAAGAWVYLPRGLTPADLERLDLVWATVLQDYKKGETRGGTWYGLGTVEETKREVS